MKWVAVTLVYLLMAACISQAAMADPRVGLFSNLYQHEMTGDLLGTELYIAEIRKGHTGALIMCEGVCAPMCVITPRFDGNRVHFDFVYRNIHGWFEGIVDSDGITGGFHFPNGGEPEPERLRRRQSYWNFPMNLGRSIGNTEDLENLRSPEK